MCRDVLRGLNAVLVVFVDKRRTSFEEVAKLKQEKKSLLQILTKHDYREYE